MKTMRRPTSLLSLGVFVVVLGIGASTSAVASQGDCVGTAVSSFAEIQAGFNSSASMCLTRDLGQTDFGSTGQLLVPVGQSPTLDLNSYTIEFTAGATKAAIQLPVGATLTIDCSVGRGLLTVTGGGWASGSGTGAGIGGDGGTALSPTGMSAGILIVNGGGVTARGGASTGGLTAGAGIGGGGGGIGEDDPGVGGNGGSVSLFGGQIVAIGGAEGIPTGAGIGGGSAQQGDSPGAGGTLTINGAGTPIGAGNGFSVGVTRGGIAAVAQLGTQPAGVSFTQESSNASSSAVGGQTRVLFSYLVTFDSSGGSAVSSVTRLWGNAVAQPADPTRDGYTFNGWRTGSASGPAYNFGTLVTEPFTLYANWSGSGPAASGGVSGGSPAASAPVTQELLAATGPSAATLGVAGLVAVLLSLAGIAVLLGTRRQAVDTTS